MKRQWLIDAYNVMHQLPDVEAAMDRDISEARRLMALKVEQLCAKRNRRARLVFDGAPGTMPISQPHLSIDYSYPDDADTFITRQVSRKGQAQRWIVVTDDRELRRNARLKGAELMRTKEFCEMFTPEKPIKSTGTSKRIHIHPAKKADIDVPDEEVRAMLRLFNKHKDDAGKNS